MIDTIIFDIGNVLAHFCFETSFKKVLNEKEFELISKASVLDEEKWLMLDKGEKNYEELLDYYSKDIPCLKEKMDLAIKTVYNDIVPFDYSNDWIKEYKNRGFKVYILSNYGEIPFKLSSTRFDFLNYTDGAVISYQVKQIKPTKEIYKAICDKYSITPSNAVFIDDNLKNIEGSKLFGINSVLFQNYKQAKTEVEKFICNK
ncbi:MAG: HAD family phosphatase [Clostridia bacterium]